ncbi:hypothetical protein FJT64_010486 [Amphibalanus amphitrite]|uniref:Uncharacterized protein n=1 Tax=Amphibalanus amphitrite TaxID=1232801 RepID=A0A6A4VJB5_AMPAM|nr:hypothetical protein FJT64_010486 [Amphibalanus amphitrite]
MACAAATEPARQEMYAFYDERAAVPAAGQMPLTEFGFMPLENQPHPHTEQLHGEHQQHQEHPQHQEMHPEHQQHQEMHPEHQQHQELHQDHQQHQEHHQHHQEHPQHQELHRQESQQELQQERADLPPEPSEVMHPEMHPEMHPAMRPEHHAELHPSHAQQHAAAAHYYWSQEQQMHHPQHHGQPLHHPQMYSEEDYRQFDMKMTMSGSKTSSFSVRDILNLGEVKPPPMGAHTPRPPGEVGMVAEEYGGALYPAAYPYPEEGYEYRQPAGGYRAEYYEPRWPPAEATPVYPGQWGTEATPVYPGQW